MNSIPASQLVSVVPGVLGAGGNPLSLNGVMARNTVDAALPLGTILSFPTQQAVSDWFGPASPEAAAAAVYFNGFDGATTLPGLLYFIQYASAAAAGYLRGGSLAGVPLTTIQGLSGTLTLSIDGVSTTSLAINLSGATSFSNAAALIQTGIRGGTPVNTVTVTYDSQRAAFVITSATTGASSAIGAASVGTLATGLKLTAAAGAVTSPGAAPSTPAGLLATLTALTQNWATFMTLWEPITADKVAFATAFQAYLTGQRYMYVAWDTSTSPTQGADPTSFGALTAAMNGVFPVWGPVDKAAFVCGATAAINFTETNGRITYAYKKQAGLAADVTDETTANNLIGNGYNFYGAYADAVDQFLFLQNGQISGEWVWADAFVNQIKMNSDFRLALVSMLAAVKSVPYVTRGYDLIRAALQSPINQFLNFGAIVGGVSLSALQRAQVNTAAGGLNIADTLQSRGWYLLIQDAPPSTRAVRGSPPCTFWYTDGGSIQKINLASIDVE